MNGGTVSYDTVFGDRVCKKRRSRFSPLIHDNLASAIHMEYAFFCSHLGTYSGK